MDVYLEQGGGVDERYDQGEQHGQFPVSRDSVQHGGAQETGEVEQVEHRSKRATELGLANFATVRYREAGDETDVEAHQRRTRVQPLRAVGEHQHEYGQDLRKVREHHAYPVAEPVLY